MPGDFGYQYITTGKLLVGQLGQLEQVPNDISMPHQIKNPNHSSRFSMVVIWYGML
jgi:hypothetical protein